MMDEALFATPLRKGLLNFERMYLQYHLRQCQGKIEVLSRVLKTNRPYLYRRLRKCGIDLAKERETCQQ